MRCDYIIMPGSEPDAPPSWIRLVNNHIVQRGTGERWRHVDEAEEGPIDGEALLVLPPHATTLHWIACPEMTERQGAQAAKIMALEASIGAGAGLHASVLPSETPEQPHIVAVTSESAMTHWINWCTDRGMPNAHFVPAALMLPAPESGFIRGLVGPNEVVRGVDTAFDAEEPAARLIMGREPVTDLTEPSIDDMLQVALLEPPLDMREGPFAVQTPGFFEPGRVKRMAIMIGLILLVGLLVSLVRVVKLNMEASSLDARTVELARTVDPAIVDAADAEVKLSARLAERGGNGAFTGAMAGLMTAMRGTPAVSLASVNQAADGTLRVRLSGARAEDINAVLLALQDAGWRISADAVQQQGDRLVADIQVVR
ncbi:MAG: general secretion pathway protein GspL [Sphingobium sp.]|nr:general secretion pathway protein GspL [Sphingobium sp.]